MADLQEAFWDNLLDYIQDRTVVPIIGSDLVTVREGDQDVPTLLLAWGTDCRPILGCRPGSFLWASTSMLLVTRRLWRKAQQREMSSLEDKNENG